MFKKIKEYYIKVKLFFVGIYTKVKNWLVAKFN